MGSSRTLSNMICEPVPPLEGPNEDLFNTIDNNQKVGIHSGRIREGSKVPVSVCTSMCHIVPQLKTCLQYSDSLNLENWRNCPPITELLKKVKELENSCVTEFQRYRGLFIEEMIECVVKEQKIDSLLDYIDIAVANEGKIKLVLNVQTHTVKKYLFVIHASLMLIIIHKILIHITGLSQNILLKNQSFIQENHDGES